MEGHSKIRTIPDGMMLIEITFLKIVKRGNKNNIAVPENTKVSQNSKKDDDKQSYGGSGGETV